MSSDGSTNGAGHRRSSITQAALSNLFQRGPSNNSSGGSGQMNSFDPQRRRLSVTTIGLSGTSPTNPPTFNVRRGSMSTNSDSIDENAIEDEDVPPGSARTAPTTPFVRRMSFGASAMRGYRPGGNSPGNGNNPASPPSSLGRRASQNQGPTIGAALSAANRRASTAKPSPAVAQASNTMPSRASSDNANSRADQQGFNWSEQLRSRAESSVSAGPRPSFSLASSPPRAAPHHDRAKSVSDMMHPPVQAPPPVQQPKQEPRKPDAFQERILKGDFYMD
ncbi:uncharacterized protein MAM_06840 [Metarhizium album ARSEF 1941]|uniref:Uncharacterized protein n=1 Tax=Metarhizium album (strain ARSEF 1941) TaxID=1081103 RepID=A0A0B2WH65_METAS|nr:uncharacterized protein MAM_06840 [Metarhizium album ARSEF 1941]KHN95336.1 hypothetical protein MAM_06840 [Metarhizium album ARSEF 1941]